MTKKLLITLSIFALFANSTKASDNNSATHDEGVVINGIRWATRNVDMPGTFVETPECSGMLFQWNRPYGWRSAPHYTDESFLWGYYPDGSSLWKYSPTQRWNPTIGGWENANWDTSIPTGTKWYAKNDPCPPGWRVPTFEELEILDFEYIESEWTAKNGVNGRLFGTAPNQLFLPAAGWRNDRDGSLNRVGVNGDYWSSTQYDAEDAEDEDAMALRFNSDDALVRFDWRRLGLSVRCVSK